MPAKGLIFGQGDDGEGSCEAMVTVTRTRMGTVDGALDSDSKLRLHQVRSVKLTSVP